MLCCGPGSCAWGGAGPSLAWKLAWWLLARQLRLINRQTVFQARQLLEVLATLYGRLRLTLVSAQAACRRQARLSCRETVPHKGCVFAKPAV